MEKLIQLKNVTLKLLSGHCALTVFTSMLYIAVINNNKSKDAFMLLVIAGLFSLVVSSGKKEIEQKIKFGVKNKIYYHPLIPPVLVVLFALASSTSRFPNKIFYLIGALICIGLSIVALINYIANTAIEAKEEFTQHSESQL